jgi:hypothetical protein
MLKPLAYLPYPKLGLGVVEGVCCRGVHRKHVFHFDLSPFINHFQNTWVTQLIFADKIVSSRRALRLQGRVAKTIIHSPFLNKIPASISGGSMSANRVHPRKYQQFFNTISPIEKLCNALC